MKEKQLLEIYSSSEDSFAVGFLIYQDKKNILINCLDDQGRYDGYLLMKKEYIEKIEEKSDYLEKLKKYQDFWGKTGLGQSDNPIFNNRPNFYDLIQYSQKYKKIINLASSFDYYDYTTGLIKYSDEKTLIIKAIDQNSGKFYEEFEIDIKDIVLIEVENIDNLLLEYINKK